MNTTSGFWVALFFMNVYNIAVVDASSHLHVENMEPLLSSLEKLMKEIKKDMDEIENTLLEVRQELGVKESRLSKQGGRSSAAAQQPVDLDAAKTIIITRLTSVNDNNKFDLKEITTKITQITAVDALQTYIKAMNITEYEDGFQTYISNRLSQDEVNEIKKDLLQLLH